MQDFSPKPLFAELNLDQYNFQFNFFFPLITYFLSINRKIKTWPQTVWLDCFKKSFFFSQSNDRLV